MSITAKTSDGERKAEMEMLGITEQDLDSDNVAAFVSPEQRETRSKERKAIEAQARYLAQTQGGAVEVCGGEADADKMAELGLLATTVAGQNWSETAAEALMGRDVNVWEHNDEAGRENSEAAVKMLSPVAKRTRVVRLPGLPHRGDVRDWLKLGHTTDE